MILALALLSGCTDIEPYEGMFDLPAAAAVLPMEHMAPFDEPVGYVADRYGGRIGILALKQGMFLGDTPSANFVRGAPIATGAGRLITSIAAWSPTDEEIHVFAGDRTYRTLVRATHVASLDAEGFPVRAPISWGDAAFTDADGSGDNPTLSDLTFKAGYSTSESFLVERTETGWWVTGSRSGLLPGPVLPGVPYLGIKRSISFTLQGEGTVGDFFEVAVDAGIVEYDVGGVPLHIATSPDQRALAVVVEGEETRHFTWFDPETGTPTEVDLGGSPDRLAFTPDGNDLFVGNLDTPAVHHWSADTDRFETIDLPWPVEDVAPLVQEDGSHLLFLHRRQSAEVWMYSTATGQLVDANPFVPGTQGMTFLQPVRGLEPIHDEVVREARNGDNERTTGRGVAVALQDNRVVFMAEESGCVLRGGFGAALIPYSDLTGSVDYIDNFRSSVGSPPYLAADAWTGEAVSFPSCGGLTQFEEWTLTYRSALGGWQVDGSQSGLQSGVVYEDSRYLSDNGEISLLMRSGGTPSRDGWRIEFRTSPGLVEADAESFAASSGRNITLALPADPVYFRYMAGPAGEQTLRPYLLVVAEGADLAARVHPGDGDVEATWW